MESDKIRQSQDSNILTADISSNNQEKQPIIQQEPNKNNKKKLCIIVGAIAGIVAAIGIAIGILTTTGAFNKVTICTQMDYHGDTGPCIEEKTVEIVSTPESPNDCPADTEPVYDVVGGFVGIEFVGCVKK